MVPSYSMISPRVPFTQPTPYSYPMSPPWPLICDQKWAKTVEKQAPILPITSFHGTMNGLQLSNDINDGALYTQNSI
jgi:hypothetical protein